MKLSPTFLLHDCPFEVNFDFEENKRILLYYNLKFFFRKSLNAPKLKADHNSSTVVIIYWNKYFFKTKVLKLNIHFFETRNTSYSNNNLLNIPLINSLSINTSQNAIISVNSYYFKSFFLDFFKSTNFNKPVQKIKKLIIGSPKVSPVKKSTKHIFNSNFSFDQSITEFKNKS